MLIPVQTFNAGRVMGCGSESACGAGRCERCESLPEISVSTSGRQHVHIWVPTAHTLGKLLAAGKKAGARADGRESLYVAFEIDRDGVDGLLMALDDCLLEVESLDSRVLVNDRIGITPSEIGRVSPLRHLASLARAGWVLSMIRESRLTSHYQPIIHVARPQTIVGNEALLRGTMPDGSVVPAGDLFTAAKDGGLTFQLDLAARRAAIEGVGRLGLRGLLFVNFMPTTIYDPEHCLRATVRAIDEAELPHQAVVFEVVESERTVDAEHLRRILDFYRHHGFRVALDDVGSGYSSLNLIHQLRPDFLKLDRELTHGVTRDPVRATVAAKLLEMAAALGIHTVAEGVETPQEFEWLREHGATYAQGYLFAKPAADPVREISFRPGPLRTPTSLAAIAN